MQNHSASTILFLTITQRAGNVPNSSNHYDGKGFKKIQLLNLLSERGYFGVFTAKDFNICKNAFAIYIFY